jgi:hypothetical protein
MFFPFNAQADRRAAAGSVQRLVELSRYRGRIFPSPFMANIET